MAHRLLCLCDGGGAYHRLVLGTECSPGIDDGRDQPSDDGKGKDVVKEAGQEILAPEADEKPDGHGDDRARHYPVAEAARRDEERVRWGAFALHADPVDDHHERERDGQVAGVAEQCLDVREDPDDGEARADDTEQHCRQRLLPAPRLGPLRRGGVRRGLERRRQGEYTNVLSSNVSC